MSRLTVFALWLCLWTFPLNADPPNSVRVGDVELRSGDTVVFLGDSITHQRLYTQYIEDFFITRYPRLELAFHNAGIGGDRAWDALQRLERDVVSKDPALVTILLGMNDGRYQPFDREIFETYTQDMAELLDRLQQSGAGVVPITPTMFDARAARQMLKRRPRDPEMLAEYNSVLAYFGTWLRGEADRRSMRSIDMFSPLNQLTRQTRQDEPEFTFIADAIHPGAAGQLIMAHAWLDDLGLRGPVSNLVFVPTGKGYRSRVVGGAVSDLEHDAEGFAFTFLADSLPWVTPDATAKAAEMLRLDHRFSREGFQVHGLPAGKYQLTIDDASIGTFTHIQLAGHIELQRFPSTPQSVQSAKVVAMNRTRNETTVKALRDHWYAYRNLQRKKRELAESKDPDQREKLSDQIQVDQQKMDGFEETLTKLEQQADAELAAIYQAAQPVPHRYVLRRVD